MTEQAAKNKLVAWALSQVGYAEGANNWNKYAAELDPLKITFGNKQNAPWCAEFDLWLFVTTFGVDDGLKMLCSPKPTAIPLCASGAQYFKNAGQWSSTPELGAIVFYYLSGNRMRDINFILEDALSFDGNTGPYVQYTYARTCSVLEKVKENCGGKVVITCDEEADLIKTLSQYEEKVLTAMLL